MKLSVVTFVGPMLRIESVKIDQLLLPLFAAIRSDTFAASDVPDASTLKRTDRNGAVKAPRAVQEQAFKNGYGILSSSSSSSSSCSSSSSSSPYTGQSVADMLVWCYNAFRALSAEPPDNPSVTL
ncbi:hypothetical protein EYF80_018619 [Liparis tanakae]|uniref:Uncharacterized protein n=1 Tax=Liparis tanakae TaxID=230148 RepID=A0A4Z2HZ18_9TELE|nr:hypothetical protein EYF80_018619 [Liparis tanakae]